MSKVLLEELHCLCFGKCRAEKADMIIAVTRNDETNMIVCQLASSLFNVSKKLPVLEQKIF